MINDVLDILRGDVLCNWCLGTFADSAHITCSHTPCLSDVHCRGEGGLGAAYICVLRRVDREEGQHWHITSKHRAVARGSGFSFQGLPLPVPRSGSLRSVSGVL